MLDDYYEETYNCDGRGDWFYDQIALNKVYEKYKNRVVLVELKECDHAINGTLDTIVYSRRMNNSVSIIDLMNMNGIEEHVIDELNHTPQKYE